jgi:hypothetical protein
MSTMSRSNLRTDVRREPGRAKFEPLQPIEKRLIGWSLSIGLALLALLAAINHFFPPA